MGFRVWGAGLGFRHCEPANGLSEPLQVLHAFPKYAASFDYCYEPWAIVSPTSEVLMNPESCQSETAET